MTLSIAGQLEANGALALNDVTVAVDGNMVVNGTVSLENYGWLGFGGSSPSISGSGEIAWPITPMTTFGCGTPPGPSC